MLKRTGRPPWRTVPGSVTRSLGMSLPPAVLLAALTVLAACHPSADHSAASSPSPLADGLMGAWAVQFRGGDGITYSGTLEVSKRTGEGAYRGDLLLRFKLDDSGYSEVEEDARITVEDGRIIVICAKPVVLTEDTEYVPDNFLLARVSQNVLKGYEKDVISVGDNATMIRK